MEEFLRDNRANVSADIFVGMVAKRKNIKHIYAPLDAVFNLLLQKLGLEFQQLVDFPGFEELILNHVDSDKKFKLSTGKIDTVPIYETLPAGDNHPAVSIIKGILATSAQNQALKEYAEELKNSEEPEPSNNIETVGLREEEVVTNPLTGRPVKVGGTVYKKLVADGVISTGEEAIRLRKVAKPAEPKIAFEQFNRGSDQDAHLARIKALQTTGPQVIQAKGWKEIAPKVGSERNALKAKAGDACFLRPQDNGYPICPKLSVTDNVPKVSCQGLAAAKNRGRFLPAEYNEKIIPQLQEYFHCTAGKATKKK